MILVIVVVFVVVTGRVCAAMTMTPIKLKVTREDTVQNSSAGNNNNSNSAVFSFSGVGDFLTPYSFSRNSFTAGSGKFLLKMGFVENNAKRSSLFHFK